MGKSMPVEWHRERLKNAQDSLRRYDAELARERERIDRLRALTDFLLRQITEAERRGKTEFDADRYLVKRAKKDATE
ncbi:MAG TPA: hypothetical protein VGR45_06280 [Stellaceae bacterium]|nr:hypothetical protein [Stellaceae bacterium]